MSQGHFDKADATDPTRLTQPLTRFERILHHQDLWVVLVCSALVQGKPRFLPGHFFRGVGRFDRFPARVQEKQRFLPGHFFRGNVLSDLDRR